METKFLDAVIIILFLILIITAIAKMFLHQRLIKSNKNSSGFLEYFNIAIYSQPFFPIIKDQVGKKNINLLVLIFYAVLTILILFTLMSS